jgi:type II secretory pathway pseudopilin PulG
MGGLMPKLRDNSGMSIIEVLLGVAVIALVVPFGLKIMLNTNKVNKKTEERLDLRNVTRTLTQRVDCANVPASCSAGSLLTLPKKGGGQLVSNAGNTVMGGWTVRALCTGGNEFKVQIARMLPGGQFAKDPVNNVPLDFNHPKATLIPERGLCLSEEDTPPAEPEDLMEVIPGASCFVTQLSQLPCAAPNPPQCPAGYASAGLSLDGWGGDDDPVNSDVFGQRWIRYCIKLGT